MIKFKNVAVLLTVHNRKETTLKCLSSLYLNMKECSSDYIFDIYLTDDGSTDGTYEAISELYPEVHIIKGDGTLFWCRGMINSWKYAVSQKQYDYFLWANDDTILLENAFTLIFKSNSLSGDNAIIGGAFCSVVDGHVTYGGKTLSGEDLLPNGKLQQFDLLHGNLVLVPRTVYEQIGMLDASFHHGIGDYDYGLRALKKGIKLYLTPEYVGTCEGHLAFSKCYDVKYGLFQRFRFLYSPLGPNPNEVFIYISRHYSIFRAAVVYLASLSFAIFPSLKPFFVKSK